MQQDVVTIGILDNIRYTLYTIIAIKIYIDE